MRLAVVIGRGRSHGDRRSRFGNRDRGAHRSRFVIGRGCKCGCGRVLAGMNWGGAARIADRSGAEVGAVEGIDFCRH